MRVLVVSDTHGNLHALLEAIDQQPHAKQVLCLGDGVSDYETAADLYPDREFILVRGNCDYGGNRYPLTRTLEIGGVTVRMTHGHTEGVKGGAGAAIADAHSVGAQLLLFGHTHRQWTHYEDKLHILNPGSLGYRREYGVADILPNGQIMVIGMSL
ncbi:MAG: YfcE family phosphodiesterase [Clostridia bacterium]|nr:YfcE family phosphodiesterase [Clostridia bacterium]